MPVFCALACNSVKCARVLRLRLHRCGSAGGWLTTWALSFWSSASSLKLKSIIAAFFESKTRFVMGRMGRAVTELAGLARHCSCFVGRI